MATNNHQWWVIYPANEPMSNYPANEKIAETTLGDAASRAWDANGSYKGWQVQFGPFSSLQAAQQVRPTAVSIGQIIGIGAAGVITGTTGAPPSQSVPVGAQIGDALGGFNIGNWFLRIGEILLGLVLVGVGIARITGVQNFVSDVIKTKMPIPI